jgi:hypothetical protein
MEARQLLQFKGNLLGAAHSSKLSRFHILSANQLVLIITLGWSRWLQLRVQHFMGQESRACTAPGGFKE